MKSTIILLAIIHCFIKELMCQRPTYAGLSPKLGPELASRFRNPNDTSDSPFLANRVGEDNSNANLPTDARGDENLVNRLNQWPREHRPFWLINAEHIERHRHPDENIQQQRPASSTDNQTVNLSNRNSFDNNENLEIVNGILGSFDKNLDGSENINLSSRGSFQETRPIKPNLPRSSFLRPTR